MVPIYPGPDDLEKVENWPKLVSSFVSLLYLLLFHSHYLQLFSGLLDNILPGL